MPEPSEELVQSNSHVFETRQASAPDLDLYEDKNRDAFAERVVEKYVGKRWAREESTRTKYDISHEMTLGTKVKKYNIKTAGQPDAESYVRNIETQHVENNRTAYKRKKSAGNALGYYKDCNKKTNELNRLRTRIDGERNNNQFRKLKRKEYDLEMSLLDTRLKAMIEAAKAKSIGADDEAIRILKSKLAILICKERLTKDRSTDEREDRLKAKYDRLAEGYTRQIVELRQQLENAMREKYGEDLSEYKKGKKLLTIKEKQKLAQNRYMETVTEEESPYLLTRLYEEDQIHLGAVHYSATPTKELLAQDFERFAYGAGKYQVYSESKDSLVKTAGTKAGRERLDGYRRERAEILTSIDQITEDQSILAIKKMVVNNCLPNCLIPILNVMCLDTNNETIHDKRFFNLCVKPLLKDVTTSAAIGIIKDAANITEDQVSDVKLEMRQYTYIDRNMSNKWEAAKSGIPKNLYMAVREAQQYTIDKFEQRLGMQDDRIYRHMPSSELGIPLQGTKIHVGFATRYEFLEYVPILAKEFIRLGVRFKLLNGNHLIEKKSNDEDKYAYDGKMKKDTNITKNCGKEITIYPNQNFDPDLLSEEARKILYQRSTYNPTADKKTAIRMSVRYGGFLSENLLNIDGECEHDERYMENNNNRDSRELDVEDIVQFYKDLKAEYDGDKTKAKKLIQAYCLGTKVSKKDLLDKKGLPVEQDLFDVYVLDDQKSMNDCVRSIPTSVRHSTLGAVRLHLFGVYMVAVPKVLQAPSQYLQKYESKLLESNLSKLADKPW